MKKVKLQKIMLRDWKSLNIEVSFGDVTEVKGKNGVGKSSIIAAWNWLLSGYTNSTAPKNHELFDNKSPLSPDTPKAIVEAIVSIDGCDFKLCKIAEAKFTRKRGSSEYEKASSDSYTTMIDDIEYSATQYKEWIEANICPEQMLQYNLSGEFFSTLCEEDKNKARKVLENLVGEIKDEDFKNDYSLIREELSKRSIEQIIEAYKNKKKPLDERLVDIPKLIQEKDNLLVSLSDINFEEIVSEIEEKRKKINEIDDLMLGYSESIKPIIDKRNDLLNQISAIRSEIVNEKLDFERPRKLRIDELRNERMNIISQNNNIKERNIRAEYEFNQQKQKLESLNKNIDALTLRRENLLDKRDEIKSRVFTPENCSYCGQELPADKIAELQSAFNEQKERELEAVIAEGKSVRELIDNAHQERLQLMNFVNNGLVLEKEHSLEEITSELDVLEKNKPIYEESDIYKTLISDIKRLEGLMPEIPNQDNEDLTQRKRNLLSEIEDLNQRLGMKTRIEELNVQISSLQSEKRDVGNQIASIEQVLLKCKDWIEERANIISERINTNLTYCKIKMWQTQKNGDMVPACIITSNEGVKYATLNNSNRIKTCISLQELFNRYYGIQMPIFIDEASVFDSYNLPQPDGQVVYLYAGDNEKMEILTY